MASFATFALLSFEFCELRVLRSALSFIRTADCDVISADVNKNSQSLKILKNRISAFEPKYNKTILESEFLERLGDYVDSRLLSLKCANSPKLTQL